MNREVMFKINFQVCYQHRPPRGYFKEIATGRKRKEKWKKQEKKMVKKQQELRLEFMTNHRYQSL